MLFDGVPVSKLFTVQRTYPIRVKRVLERLLVPFEVNNELIPFIHWPRGLYLKYVRTPLKQPQTDSLTISDSTQEPLGNIELYVEGIIVGIVDTSRPNWELELLTDLKTLAANPEQYRLRRSETSKQ